MLIRSFIAIPIEKSLQIYLAKQVSILREEAEKTGCKVKWVSADLYHITLRFLGNISQERLSLVSKQLYKLCSSVSPIEAKLSEISFLPNAKHPRVLVTKLIAPSLLSVANTIESTLQKHKFSKSKQKFRPHITLGRIREPKSAIEFAHRVPEIVSVNDSPRVKIDTVILYQSDLVSSGPVYTPITTIPLSKE